MKGPLTNARELGSSAAYGGIFVSRDREYSGVSRLDRGEEELTVRRFWEGLSHTVVEDAAVAIRRVQDAFTIVPVRKS